MQSDSGIIEVKNISNIRKHNFSKSVEVKFYIKVKEHSDLEVQQYCSFSSLIRRKIKILLKVTNLGPDPEPNAILNELITNYKSLEFVSVTVSKGTYIYIDGEFKWNIGKLSSKENCFALITLRTKTISFFKSMAIVCGENFDPYLLNNIDFEVIPPFGKLIYSCLRNAITQLEKDK